MKSSISTKKESIDDNQLTKLYLLNKDRVNSINFSFNATKNNYLFEDINLEFKEAEIVFENVNFDYSKEDGASTLTELKNILERNGHMIKAKAGSNYGDMNDISDRL